MISVAIPILLGSWLILGPTQDFGSDSPTKALRWGRLSSLAAQSPVVAELKLARNQAELVAKIADREEENRISFAEAEDALSKILDGRQMGRLREIRTQFLGALLLLDDNFARNLPLTESQKEEIRSILPGEEERLRRTLSTIRFTGPRELKGFVVEFWRTNEPLQKILSAEQRATFEKMKGHTFEKLDQIVQ